MYRLTDAQRARVRELLSRMTLEEKIGQMNQESMSIVGGFDVPFEELIEMLTDGRLPKEEFDKIMSTAKTDYHEDEVREGLVGSLMVQDAEKYNELQHIAVEESRLGIPLLIGLDVIHGFRTVYPIAIAEAGTFDEKLFQRTAAMAAKESRSQGINWHFAPMVDVARDARWGRVSEGPGEDTRLASRFARAKIQGLQGDMSSPENYVAACLKHYVAYGACESGRDYNTASMAPAQLYNVYLPPFRAAVEAGAATVMASFNDLNGVPCTVNRLTLRQILKGEWKFPGLVVSDANAIRECVNHGIAADQYDAGVQAANAGMDIDMGTRIYIKELKRAVEEGKVPLSVIDEAAERILSVKMWLGLFEHPYVSPELAARYETLPEAHLALAREAGERSIVLLKNENGLLPLDKSKKISLVGKLAAERTEVVGAWALSWRESDCVSIQDGFDNAGANYRYFPCCGPEGELDQAQLEEAAAWGDVIVAVVGETTAMSGEASSKADITLPGKQRELLEKLLAGGKPVAALLMNGRPLALEWESVHVPAILECWHLGVQMGNAVASVLFGDRAPEGKLASSFPRMTGQCPIYYSHPNTGRPGGKGKFTSRYLDAGWEPLYPFGYGLSYTEFAYDGLEVKDAGDTLMVSVDVRNTGSRPGVETVQLYTRDVTASIVRPVKELKDFAKAALAPGEQKRVTMAVQKNDLGFFNDAGQYVLEDGKFIVYVGGNSRDCLSQEIEVTF
ncbi:MAG: glycoside hydrolase family 3 C-terminal domain-containing protein [Oscillospiraceae bacterium]|nr:glycoside hydrolase family 3 C-terminal domain-containing protein [Oscillospiraceae bacterium]